MVVGLDKFSAHFAGYQDRYVLIGGAAAWIVLNEAGINPRATKDLDIVLCLEALDSEFGILFWNFVKQAGYENKEKSTGHKIFYRFWKPAVPDYPFMLELFSRKPDTLVLEDESHLTPIPVSEDVSSLSAILLDETYYHFLHAHKREIEGISIIDEQCLIPLKARAWLDLVWRKAGGGEVDSRDIKKHRNDVLRLFRVLSPELRIALPDTIRNEIDAFIRAVEPELSTQILKQMDIKGIDAGEILQTIKKVYCITKG
ncbi:MAG: hypothetical protein M0P57_08990 [Syntrophales bacterium]|jgi:hypothetical protein|nr:hypothetical protein [Syntrophales bacterium]MDY0044908.1 hypothetical protein [Syntrophales bacterium]